MKTQYAVATCLLGVLACQPTDDPGTWEEQFDFMTWEAPITTAAGLCRSQVLVAERRYSPNQWLDARATLPVGLHFRIPASVPVSRGNSGNHPTLLRFGASADDPQLVTCTYRGVGMRAAPTDPTEIAAANRYDLVSCSDGAIAGAEVTASYLYLRVSSGGDYIVPGARTAVTLALNEASGCCEGTSPPPGTVETCDSIDNDCDAVADEGAGGPWFVDADRDGSGDPATAIASCAPVAGRILAGGDCNDRSAAIHPGAAEVCNSVDEDCDGATDEGVLKTFFRDGDRDTFGSDQVTVRACSPPAQHVARGGDCNDAVASTFPGAVELCDRIDNDCDGTGDDGWFLDDDADGFGDPARPANGTCSADRFVDNSRDCNDRRDDVSPRGIEVCDGVDQDCDGVIDDNAADAPVWFRDRDGDGFGNAAEPIVSCTQPSGAVVSDADCNDGDPNTFPGAPEIPGDGRDNDCNGVIDG